MLHFKVVPFVVNLLLILDISQAIRYDNHRVYEILPKTKQNYEFLRDLDGFIDGVTFLDGLAGVGIKSYAIASPEADSEFLQNLRKGSITHSMIEDNIQKSLDAHLNPISTRTSKTFGWQNYRTLEEIYDWMRSVAKKERVVTLIKVGESFENRDILGLKISFGEGRSGVFIEGGIHSREWLGPAVVTYIMNEIINNNDTLTRNIAENCDWYIVPTINPDGYVYTHTDDRLWRKTRSRVGSCVGVDLNRNFGFHWNATGRKFHSCSNAYPGYYPFSEKESRTLSEYVTSIKQKLRIYLSMQAYGQLLVFPYGHTKEHAENHKDLLKIANIATQALASRYGTKYKVGNTFEAAYKVSGGSSDWAYGQLGIKLAYTYSLRPAMGVWDGFKLPPNLIIPTADETLESILGLIIEASKLGYLQ